MLGEGDAGGADGFRDGFYVYARRNEVRKHRVSSYVFIAGKCGVFCALGGSFHDKFVGRGIYKLILIIGTLRIINRAIFKCKLSGS